MLPFYHKDGSINDNRSKTARQQIGSIIRKYLPFSKIVSILRGIGFLRENRGQQEKQPNRNNTPLPLPFII